MRADEFDFVTSAVHFNQLAFRARESKIAKLAEDDPYWKTSHQELVVLAIAAHNR
jgi:hypothetical protein